MNNDDPADDEGFLQRWSRRKRTSGQEAGLKKVDTVEESTPAEPAIVAGRMITEPSLLQPATSKNEDKDGEEEAAQAADTETGEVIASDTEETSDTTVEDLEKIDFDALDFDSDYTRFMKAGVPEFVRRKALRKLWASNPILANIDGLNDYDEDFTDAKLAVANLQTAFKAQHGYMTDEEVEAQKRLGREEEYDAEQERLEEEQQVTASEEGEDLEPETAHGEQDDVETAQTSDKTDPSAMSDKEDDDHDLGDDGDSDWA